MPILDRPTVANYVLWGNLIKHWSKNEQDRPADGDLESFKKKCFDAQVGLKMPTYITKFRVVAEGMDTFVLRLPSAQLIKESEEFLGTGGVYPIPDFYNLRYHSTLTIPEGKMMDFHAERIGDYTISLCV